MIRRRVRTGILFGGRSCEHEVSIQSARGVLSAIDRDKYEPVPIGVTKDGEWVLMRDDQVRPGKLLSRDCGPKLNLVPDPTCAGLLRLEQTSAMHRKNEDVVALDLIFPLIHGPMGEDGTVQGLFELAGIPYVGSGVLASAVGMDKVIMKVLFERAGLPVTPCRTFLRSRWDHEHASILKECEAALAYPWFIKPANMGSSVGVSKVHERAEFQSAMDEAARYDRKLIVEAAVEDAREIEAAVLGNDQPKVSILGEIIPCNEFYDYRAKYVDNTSGLMIPAELPDSVVKRIQSLSLTAYWALDCAGLARVDFLLRRSDHAVFVSEINTLPGFTPISMYPKLWEASGISYTELISQLLELAFERHGERRRNQTTYSAA
ncbi:MAG: D-alanine--D-alanine ligase family protein [Gammaproteobacteria bacterium]